MNPEDADKSAAVIQSTKKLILGLAQALVLHEDQVKVKIVMEESRVIFILDVDPSDLGRIIGKEGRTARALRTIIRDGGMKTRYHFALDIPD
jgi:uncharacterized protein